MAEELQRNFDGLLKKKADPAPYFLSYEITDQDTHNVSATLGVLNSTESERNRSLDVTVRVGDPKLDNFRRVRGDRIQFTSGSSISIDDAPVPIRQEIWLETDRVYRAAAERLIKIKTNQQVKAADRDTSNDFSSEESYSHWEAPATITFDSAAWTKNVRDLSRVNLSNTRTFCLPTSKYRFNPTPAISRTPKARRCSMDGGSRA